MKINQIHSEMPGIIVAGCMTYIGIETIVRTRFGEAAGDREYPRAVTGKIALSSLRDQIDLVEEWGFVKVENGFVQTYCNRFELNLENRGRIVALSRSVRKARSNEV